MSKTKTKVKIRIAANGYRLCDALPKGEPLIDSTNKEWILGSTIGSGGFGDIYSCGRKGGTKGDEYVVKLDNIDGPLFAEMNFYIRVAKEADIRAFMERRGLRFLGMPEFVANGIHDKSSAQTNRLNKHIEANSQKKSGKSQPTLQYRFLVMRRFGHELEGYVKDRRLSAAQVADIAVKMIDVLQYIHSFGYIHADIKATNILKSTTKSKASNDWYLVDYGLAERFRDSNDKHREERPDKKRANNGTVEYRSRDAHIGLISRRSDIECLAYNLIQWLYGTLPWMPFLTNANKVEESKRHFMANVDKCLTQCFTKSVPNGLKEFFVEVNKIGHNSEPNYDLLKQILTTKVAKNKIIGVTSDEEVLDDEKDRRRSGRLRPNAVPKRVVQQKKRTVDVEVIELSDSEDSRSPPKRSKSRTKPLIESESRLNVHKRTPMRTAPTKPMTPFRTPLLFESDTESERSGRDDSGRRSSGRRRATNGSASDVELCRGGETPAMAAMRVLIERKKMAKQTKNMKKRL